MVTYKKLWGDLLEKSREEPLNKVQQTENQKMGFFLRRNIKEILGKISKLLSEIPGKTEKEIPEELLQKSSKNPEESVQKPFLKQLG